MAFRKRLLVLLVVVAAFAAAPASAQGWFGNFFGGGGPFPRQGAPAYPGYGGGYRGGGYGYGYGPPQYGEEYRARPRRHVQKRRPEAPAQEDTAEEAPKPQKNASLFVYVFGDSLGQMLADGLDDALADRADVAVVHKAKGSTGLVATDFYDWPKTIGDLLAGKETKEAGRGADDAASERAGGKAGAPRTPKIDVAVMMVGSNDKQAIREGGKTFAVGTQEWKDAYTRRVATIDEAFHARGIPLVWVGVPITKDDDFADAMAGLNDLTREAAAKTGATYVDTWEAFSDDNGDFSAFGPDINGQTMRLRSPDGVHFTKAGARKLAHFVEAHVRRALDGKTPAPQLPTVETPEGKGGKPVAAAKPDAGPIRNLVETPEAKGGELAALPGPPKDAAPEPPVPDDPKRDALAATTIGRGEAVPIPAGRADDARWPAKGVPEP